MLMLNLKNRRMNHASEMFSNPIGKNAVWVEALGLLFGPQAKSVTGYFIFSCGLDCFLSGMDLIDCCLEMNMLILHLDLQGFWN